MVKIKGKLIELSERYDDVKMYGFFLAVVEIEARPALDFSKDVIISQDGE